MRVVREYRARLEQLRAQYSHSIRILDDGSGQMDRFNCFAYAFGVWPSSRYDHLYVTTQASALMNSAFVSEMLSGDQLDEIHQRDVRPGDLILYFSAGALKHAGRIVSASSGLIIHSKWGGNEVHEHALWEVSAEYGDIVRFCRRPDPGTILARLEILYSGTSQGE